MTTLYCGDPHGQFRHIRLCAERLQPTAIVLLGDMEPKRPLAEELAEWADRTWFIHGNHDTDSDDNWRGVWGSTMADRNVNGRVVQLPDGQRLAGLGGVFRASVWDPSPAGPTGGVPVYRTRSAHAKATPRLDRWEGSHSRKHFSTIYPDEVDRMMGLRADVLDTHEAPIYHPHGFQVLDNLARAMGVRIAIHGHHHDSIDSSARWAVQGFRSYGVGLRGITAVDAEGRVVVANPGER